MLRKRQLGESLAAIASALLLSTAYPPINSGMTAFFALVPLLVVLRHANPGRGFFLGWLFGFAFRLVNLSWLLSLKNNGAPFLLVLLGLLALAAYTALYTGLFGYVASSFWYIAQKKEIPKPLLFRTGAFVAEPLLWVGAEYLVGCVLTGFPWNPLAATQVNNLALLSSVSLFGAATLSAIILLTNSSLTSLAIRIWYDLFAPRFYQTEEPRQKPSKAPRTIPLTIAVILIIITCWHGIDSVRHFDKEAKEGQKIKIALIHPDIPCIFEQNGTGTEDINEALLNLTKIAAMASPDMTIWPETILPGFIPYDRDAANLITQALAETKTPLIAGGVEYIRNEAQNDGILYNSAFYFIPGPTISNVYRKCHLVPFGEYIPLESKFPFLKRLAPQGFSLEAGKEQTIFTINAQTNNFKLKAAPLICFEDVFPYQAREAAQNGANALISLANDSWFDKTCESEQHLAQAVLRAAETQLPVFRSTNRGVSALILPNGRVIQRLGNGNGSGTPGFLIAESAINPSPKTTLYTRYGDSLFSIPAAGLLAGAAIAIATIRRLKRKFGR